MNDYKRFVSYIYNYEMKIKKNNIGYARVEIRDSELKITVHIQVKSISKGELKVYAFVRQGKNIRAIPLGVLGLRNGLGDFRVITNTNGVGKTEYNFDEVGGLLFYQNEEKYFGTEWDDQGLVYRSLLMEGGKEDAETERKNEIQAEEVIQTDTNETLQTKEDVPEEILQTEDTVLEPEIIEEEEKAEEESVIESDQNLSEPVLKAAEIKYDVPLLNREEIRPYTLDELIQEFAYQPTDQFMMHGYKRFGHLGLVKRNGRHIIGVPGIFCKCEQQIAKAAGYHNFLPKMGKSLEYGDFGYWYSSNEYLR